MELEGRGGLGAWSASVCEGLYADMSARARLLVWLACDNRASTVGTTRSVAAFTGISGASQTSAP